MVERQFLERPALVACGELTLEGLWHRGTRALLVCPSPGPGGGMDACSTPKQFGRNSAGLM
jgi:hypothetical protein